MKPSASQPRKRATMGTRRCDAPMMTLTRTPADRDARRRRRGRWTAMTSRSGPLTKVPVDGNVPAKAFRARRFTTGRPGRLPRPRSPAGGETSRTPMTRSFPAFSAFRRRVLGRPASAQGSGYSTHLASAPAAAWLEGPRRVAQGHDWMWFPSPTSATSPPKRCPPGQPPNSTASGSSTLTTPPATSSHSPARHAESPARTKITGPARLPGPRSDFSNIEVDLNDPNWDRLRRSVSAGAHSS